MSDQEPDRVIPSDGEDCGESRTMGSRGILDYGVPIISDQQGLCHQNAPPSSSFCIEDVDKAVHYSNILHDLTRFEVPSLPLQEVNPGEIPRPEEIILNTLEEGQPSSTKRRHASDLMEIQSKERDLQEDGAKEDLDPSDQSKQQKKTRRAEVHNQNERLRRQKLKEKLETLEELIPSCKKRDKASTLDDAINYIKTLQYQVQMMSKGGGYSTFHSPMMMMPQAGQQGNQIPSLSPFLQPRPPLRGSTAEMKYEIGMGIPGMFPPPDFPMSPMGLPNPRFPPPSATSRPPPPPTAASAAAAQNPGSFLEPLNLTSPPVDWAPFHVTSSGFQTTTQAVTSPVSEQSCTRGESTARVLPSRVVPPHLTNEVADCGSSHSTSSEWSSTSTAR